MLLPACMNGTYRQQYDDYIVQFKGLEVNEVVHCFGYPTQTMVAPNGNKVYIYLRERSTYIPAITNKIGNGYYTTGGNTAYDYCKTYFEVNDNGIVVNVDREGTICYKKK